MSVHALTPAQGPQRGERGELETSYQRYFPMIRARCRRVLGDADEATDLAQESFVRLWQALPRLRSEPEIAAWLYRTSSRLLIDALRSTSVRQRHAQGPALQEFAPGPDSQLLSREELRRLARLLPDEELSALVMSRFDGMTHEEISRVMTVSDRTVRRLLSRAEARLGEEVQP